MLEYEIYFEAKKNHQTFSISEFSFSESSQQQRVHLGLEELAVFNKSEESLHH